MIAENQTTVTVFYAWQSDQPAETNRYAIRTALTACAATLNQKYGVHVVVDEATRAMPGAGNIPDEIRRKIGNSDIFVGDITTINPEEAQARFRSPNANVTFELGYAVAYLGWSRVVLMFNKAFGNVEDAPFDFDRHRITLYTFTTEKVLSQGVPVTQNNVAREAGCDPSALKKSRYPALIDDIQHWIAEFAKDATLSPRQTALKTRRRTRDLKARNAQIAAQRDLALSKLVEADNKILHLTLELQRATEDKASSSVNAITSTGRKGPYRGRV